MLVCRTRSSALYSDVSAASRSSTYSLRNRNFLAQHSQTGKIPSGDMDAGSSALSKPVGMASGSKHWPLMVAQTNQTTSLSRTHSIIAALSRRPHGASPREVSECLYRAIQNDQLIGRQRSNPASACCNQQHGHSSMSHDVSKADCNSATETDKQSTHRAPLKSGDDEQTETRKISHRILAKSRRKITYISEDEHPPEVDEETEEMMQKALMCLSKNERDKQTALRTTKDCFGHLPKQFRLPTGNANSKANSVDSPAVPPAPPAAPNKAPQDAASMTITPNAANARDMSKTETFSFSPAVPDEETPSQGRENEPSSDCETVNSASKNVVLTELTASTAIWYEIVSGNSDPITGTKEMCTGSGVLTTSPQVNVLVPDGHDFDVSETVLTGRHEAETEDAATNTAAHPADSLTPKSRLKLKATWTLRRKRKF